MRLYFEAARRPSPDINLWAQEIHADFRDEHRTKLAQRMEFIEAAPLIEELLTDIPKSRKRRFLEQTITVGLDIYKGKKRKNGITDYACHPARVALLVKDAGGDEIAIAKAFLHDAIENLMEGTLATDMRKLSLDESKKYIFEKIQGFPILKRRTLRSVSALTRANKSKDWLEDPDYLPFITASTDTAIKNFDRGDSGLGDVAQTDTVIKNKIMVEDATTRQPREETEKEHEQRLLAALLTTRKSRDKSLRTLDELQDRSPRHARDFLNVTILIANLLLEEPKHKALLADYDEKETAKAAQ